MENNYINKKYFSFLVVSFSLLLAVSGYFYYTNEKSDIRKQNQNLIKTISDNKTNQITNWYEDELFDAFEIAQNSLTKAKIIELFNNDLNNENTIIEILDQIKKEHNYDEVLLTSADSKLIISSGVKNDSIHPLESLAIKEAVRNKTAVSTGFYKNKVKNKINIDFIAPVLSEENRIIALLIFEWDPEKFLYPLIDSWPTPSKTAETYLVKKEGDKALFLNDLKHKANTSLEFSLSKEEMEKPAVQAITGYSGIYEGSDYRNENVFAYINPVPKTPWFLISKIDTDELYSGLYLQAVIITFIVIMLVLLFALGLSYIYTNKQKNIFSELYNKERKLSESRELFKVTMQSLGEGVITIDLNEKVVYMNKRAEDITEWGLREAKGRKFHEIYNVVNEQSGKKENNIMDKVLKNGIVKALANHTLLISKSGKKIPVIDTGSPIYDSEGSVIGVAIVFQDETDRRNNRRQLAKSEDRYRKLTELSPYSIFVNYNNEIIFANEACINLLGAESKEQILGKSPFDIFHKDDHNLVQDRIEKLKRGESIPPIEERLVRFDGKTIYVEVSAALYPRDNDEDAILVIAHDITEKKEMINELVRAKEKAEESDRLKTVFLSNMSHEIRTPMNGIVGFTSLLKNADLSHEDRLESITHIENSSERMMNTINDIIKISKVESGEVEIVKSEVYLNNAIEDIYSRFSEEAEEKGLKFEYKTDLSDEDSFISTDYEKFYTILYELVDNAIKFTNEGSVEFGYKQINESLEFYVKDTGVGIARDKWEVIFERFRQSDETLSRDHEGAGLGLSLAKAYTEILNGKIWLESEKDKGSTFYFTIPFRLEQSTNNKITKSSKPDLSDKKLKILLAEDDNTSKILISRMLENITKEIIYADTGKEAIKAFRENENIELILMDIKMPEMDGYEATTEIRKYNKDIPIIAQTAYAYPSDREKAIASGCSDYIAKPIDRQELQDCISRNLV